MKEEEKLKLEQRLEKLEDKLIETRSFTPVTKENFEKFFKDWYAKNCKKDKTKIEQEARITGREFFINLKNNKNNLDINDEDEDNIPVEEKTENNKDQKNELFYDENAFEEDLDNLNFDDDENDVEDN